MAKKGGGESRGDGKREKAITTGYKVDEKESDDGVSILVDAKTKLRKLVIKNLGCNGSARITIDLDEIVVRSARTAPVN